MSRLLPWKQFFDDRRAIRRWRRIGGIPGIIGWFGIQGWILTLPIIDPTQTIAGLDPLVVIGAGSIAGMITSWFTGSWIASLAYKFSPSRRLISNSLAQNQTDFYHRILKFRANVPPDPNRPRGFDFYGEKIMSISEYRKWLRLQVALKNSRILK